MLILLATPVHCSASYFKPEFKMKKGAKEEKEFFENLRRYNDIENYINKDYKNMQAVGQLRSFIFYMHKKLMNLQMELSEKIINYYSDDVIDPKYKTQAQVFFWSCISSLNRFYGLSKETQMELLRENKLRSAKELIFIEVAEAYNRFNKKNKHETTERRVRADYYMVIKDIKNKLQAQHRRNKEKQ